MSGWLATSYGFRETTVEGHRLSHEKPFKPMHRKILPLNATPSLLAQSAPDTIDPDISAAKAYMRVELAYINAVIESTLEVPLRRGKTSLQGSRAPSGMQAAHAAMASSTQDDYIPSVIHKVVQGGLTPTKTRPFVEIKLNLSGAEVDLLQGRHLDRAFVASFIADRLPPNGMHSVLSGSRYHWNCNTTFENPDASNQFDSQLERRVSPFLRELQKNRESPEAMTQKLVTWLMQDYDKSIVNLQNGLVHLNSCYEHFEAMRALELGPLTQETFSFEDFTTYLNLAAIFLTEYAVLKEKKEGCPSAKMLKWARNDIKFLQKLVKMARDENLPMEEIRHFFLLNRKHLLVPMEFPIESMRTRYALFLQEAHIQREAVSVYNEPCVIPSLKKLLFGMMDKGVRREPTSLELRKQIYQLCAPATPVKQKIDKRLAGRPIPFNLDPSPKRQKVILEENAT